MLSTTGFLFFMVLLLVAALLEPLLEKLRIPFSIILVVLGFACSEIATKSFGIDIGINWENFQPLIIHFLLPILIFQSAIMTDINSIRNNLLPIIMLSLPLLLVSTGITAAGLFFGIHHPDGFPWIAALLAGVILSATDPSPVLSFLRKHNAPHRLVVLLENESLFNDATAVVLYSVVISIALGGSEPGGHWNYAIISFLSVFLGGIATGIMFGIVAYCIVRIYDSGYLYILTTITGAYSSFIVAQDYFNLSGVMAVLATGFTLGLLDKNKQSRDSSKFVNEYWKFTALVAEMLIFLLAGVTITVYMFTDQWLAILIGVFACLVARALIIFGSFPVFNLVSRQPPITTRQQVILTWGGVRGTFTLALALSLPLTLDYWYTIQSIAYGVVLFTLFVQATTMHLLINRTNLLK